MAPTIHLVRHAQGYHNLSTENEQIHDPDLTTLGLQQCADLREAFPYQAKITKLFASPLRRTIYTCLHSFYFEPEPGQQGILPVVTADLLQEVSANPCDTGSEKALLEREFAGKADFGSVRDGWTEKGSGSVFEPSLEKLTIRGLEARKWLRERTEGDEHVIVVTHGAFLHFLMDDWQGIPEGNSTGWKNCEYRSYQFVDPTGEDDDAALVETGESWKRRKGDLQPLSETERRELKTIGHRRFEAFLPSWNKHLKI